jgi:quercetin dioxygenase-like cupin family protein
MKSTIIAGAAILIASIGLAAGIAQQQQPGTKRTDLQRHDLSTRGREVVQVRVDFPPGVAFGKHKHSGEEIVYVIEGLLQYQIEGRPPVTLKAGEVLFIPAGAIHSAKNVSTRNGAELAPSGLARRCGRFSRAADYSLV